MEIAFRVSYINLILRNINIKNMDLVDSILYFSDYETDVILERNKKVRNCSKFMVWMHQNIITKLIIFYLLFSTKGCNRNNCYFRNQLLRHSAALANLFVLFFTEGQRWSVAPNLWYQEFISLKKTGGKCLHKIKPCSYFSLLSCIQEQNPEIKRLSVLRKSTKKVTINHTWSTFTACYFRLLINRREYLGMTR